MRQTEERLRQELSALKQGEIATCTPPSTKSSQKNHLATSLTLLEDKISLIEQENQDRECAIQSYQQKPQPLEEELVQKQRDLQGVVQAAEIKDAKLRCIKDKREMY